MQTPSKLYNSITTRTRSVDPTNVVKKRRLKSKNIASNQSNMRPLRSRNVDVKTKENSSGKTTTGKTEKVPTTSLKPNLETKVRPKKANVAKPTTCKRNSKRIINEFNVEKENRAMELKTTETGNEFSQPETSSTPKRLQPAGRQMVLRQITNKNYRESSPFPGDKVPIYLQKIRDHGTKKHADPYEPDFISEDQHNKRRHPSEQYDKTFHEVLMQLEKKEKITKKKKATATATSSSYKKNIKNVMDRIMEQVNQRKQNIASTKDPTTSVKNMSQVVVEEQPNCSSASYHSVSPTENLCSTSDVQVHGVSTPNPSAQIKSQSSRLDLNNISQMQPDKSVNYPQEITRDSILIDFSEDSLNQVDNPLNCPQVAPEAISLDLYNDSRNEAQPVGDPHVTYKNSPYRLTGFRQSPYYMYIKPNGLPCLHQNLIIDYDLVLRLGRPIEHKLVRKMVQASMLSYVEINGNKENAINSYTLYNIEEFNVSPKKNVREGERRVLGNLKEPNVLVSTPKKGGSGDGEDIAALDLSIIEHEEIATKNGNDLEIEIHRRKFESIGPLRQYTRNTLNKPTDDLTGETGGKLFDDVEPEFLENVDDQVADLKGKKRRNQFVLDETTVEDGHRKRKKDEMTKQEKKEFQKWAKEFNEMCAEVEKHQLTIV